MRSFLAVHVAALVARASTQGGMPITAQAPMDGTPSDLRLTGLPIIGDPAQASAVVGGMAEGFMGKTTLPKIEHECIVNGVQTMAKEVVSVTTESVSLLQDILGKPPNQQSKDPLGGANLMVQIRVSIVKLMDLEMELTNDCVRGDALAELDLAAKHLRNISFVGNHLLANGADIAVELTQAIEAFQQKNFHEFGRTLGTTWRKVLLANPKNIPGGPPSKYALQQMSAGLVQGYFGKGFALTVSNLELQKPLNLKIDLHKCIGGNVPFFQSVFASAWLFFQQLSKEGPKKSQNNGVWQAALAQAFLLMPSALNKCGITAEQEAMLQESVMALGAFRFKLDIPGTSMETSEISVILASTVRDWTNAKWHKFGIDLGKMLQELVLLTYPQKYSLDASGTLKRELRIVRGSWATPLLLAGAVATLLAVAVVPRVARRFAAPQGPGKQCDEEEMSRHGMRENAENLLEDGEGGAE